MRQHDNQLDPVIVTQRRDHRPQLGFANRHVELPTFVGRQQVCGHDRGKADDADSDARAVDDGEWPKGEGCSAMAVVGREDWVWQSLRDLAHALRPYANSQWTVMPSNPRARIGAITASPRVWTAAIVP